MEATLLKCQEGCYLKVCNEGGLWKAKHPGTHPKFMALCRVLKWATRPGNVEPELNEGILPETMRPGFKLGLNMKVGMAERMGEDWLLEV